MHQKVWNSCLDLIGQKISEQSFKTWFEPIVPVRLQDKVLTIQVPSQFFYEWLEEHYVHLLKKSIDSELGSEGRLEYSVIVDKGNDKNKPVTINLPTNQNTRYGNKVAQDYTSPFKLKSIRDSLQDSNLNPQYIFESFIEGGSKGIILSSFRPRKYAFSVSF